MILRPFLRVLVGLAVGLALPCIAGAGELRSNPKAVVELFTSQGCSSCPPADKLLGELAEDAGLVALAYHVDYWDYVGWTDTFGSEAHSDRQRAYAKSWGSGRIFTPQLVVNGREGVIGSREKEVRAALTRSALDLPIKVSTRGDMLNIDIEGRAGQEDSIVWLITYLDSAQVEIERGDNAGKTVVYTNVVTGRQLLGMWEPEGGTHLKLPLDEVLTGASNGAVILVQDEEGGLPGPIRGAVAFEP